MTRVVVLAESPAARAGLASLLGRDEGLVVLGVAGGAQRLAETLATTPADVAVLVLEPGAAPPLPLALPPDAEARRPALLLIGDEPEAWAARALRDGARAVLPRAVDAEELRAAVAALAAGLAVVPAELAAELGRTAPRRRQPTAAGPALAPDAAHALTPREVEILALLAEGLGNRTIAARLGISAHTVKTHVGAVLAKLGAATRAEAVTRGARAGVIML